jgi:hypothetical protein
MGVSFNDKEIINLINEPKIVEATLKDFFDGLKEKKGHREYDYTILRGDGSCFKIKLRQSVENTLDFSAIIGFVPQNSNSWFILKRYNGKSHKHTNRLEKEEEFYDFHIHVATERYQNIGSKVEHYAEKTDRYTNLRGALRCLFDDCNVSLPNETQIELFND